MLPRVISESPWLTIPPQASNGLGSCLPKLQDRQRYASVKWWPHGSRLPVVAAQPSGLIWELSLRSQLSCAILIHNFLLPVARRQIIQSLSTRLKGGQEVEENYGGRKGIRDALSLEFLHRFFAEDTNSESAPLASRYPAWDRAGRVWCAGEGTRPPDRGFGTRTWRSQRTPAFFWGSPSWALCFLWGRNSYDLHVTRRWNWGQGFSSVPIV